MVLLSRRARKRRIRTAIALVVTVVAAEVVARLLVPVLDPVPLQWPNATLSLKYDQVEDRSGTQALRTDTPVVFVGDSGAYQAFIPSLFTEIDPERRASYNAAAPGAVPPVVRSWALDRVVPELQSRTIVWGLSPTDVAPAYGTEETVAYETSVGGSEGILASVNRTMADLSGLFRIRPALRDPSLLLGERRDEQERDVAATTAVLGGDGERMGYTEPAPEGSPAVLTERLAGYAVDPADLGAVKRTIDSVARRGIRIVLVEIPASPTMIEASPGGQADVDAFITAVTRLAEETGVNFYRPVGEFGEEAWVDGVHLTQEAAEDLTSQVASALTTLETDGNTTFIGDGTDLSQLVEQVRDENVRDSLTGLAAALDAMDEACNDPATWLREAAAVGDAMRFNRSLMETDEQGITEFRESALARRVSENIRGRALYQIGCRQDAMIGSAPSFADFQVEASRLVGEYEMLDAAFSPADDPPPVSPLWFGSSEVYHYEGLRQDDATGEGIDIALIGGTEMRFGLNQELLAELTGEKVVNLGIDRGTAEIASLWLRDVLEYVRPEEIIWAVSPADLVTSCGLDQRQDGYNAPVEFRTRLFEGLAWKPEGRSADLALGPVGAETYARTPAHERSFAQYWPDTRGLRRTADIPVPDAYEQDVEQYREPVRLALDCPSRFALHQEQVRLLTRNGVPVTIVGLPTAEELLEPHPTGVDGVMDSFDREVQGLVGAGATYVDLTDGWDRSDFIRAVALGEEARDEATRRLADEL